MKRTLTIVFVVLLVISTVIGGAVVAQKITTDKANQTPTQVATSVTPTQSTEAQKTESTQTQDLEDDTEETETNEVENISNEQISEQSDISAVGFCYRNMSNPEHCFIEVTNQHGNTLDFKITSSNGNYSHIATANISVSFDNVDELGVPYGVAEFEYVDSFGNSGTGVIDFNSVRTILTINETNKENPVWGIANASGKFI